MTQAAAQPSGPPHATVRLQLHRWFGFDQARRLVPYFSSLGLSHLYLSPILTARAGSLHGYDVVDYNAVNPELGGEDGLRALVAELRAHGMGLIADIVPNHMAVGQHDNAWWLDVLQWGRDSRYAGFFDIDWDVPDPLLNGRLLAPFLGKPYGLALAGGEIRLQLDTACGSFHAAYYDHWFPIAPAFYAPLLRSAGDALADIAHIFREALLPRSRSLRQAGFTAACSRLAEVSRQPAKQQALSELLERYAPETAAGRLLLHQLLERQHYRLAWWRCAPDEINWRRFFDVIDLAGLRAQEPAVFEATHATPLRLYQEGLVDGLRVDHVDGLADPRRYCRELRRRLRKLAHLRPPSAPAGAAYLVVEKILAPGEQLDRDWQTDGTSGYVFMNQVGALLHDPAGEAPLRELWSRRTGGPADFAEEERRARRRIPQELLTADFNACAHALHHIARGDTATRDWSLEAIKRVLAELLVHFPVYRTYADGHGRSDADAAIMAAVAAQARRTCRPGEAALVDLIDDWLGGTPPSRCRRPADRRARLRAIARFQQLTAPVAAKSVEDTAFYRHGTLLSRNEVGADPSHFSLGVDDFHRLCAERLQRYPDAMLATATHDHKRGEDVRARLAVLSEIPQRWAEAVAQWSSLNAPLRTQHGQTAPDATDEYMLYQMLAGAWPLELSPQQTAELDRFRQRLSGWQRKAIREAKRRSGWIEPNLAYEEGCEAFLQAVLQPQQPAPFLQSLHGFIDGIAAAGAINGLIQTLLRLTTPGVPDLYQGCELWDFSLVDPDNRRPVDFAARTQALEDTADDAELLRHWRDGRIKQRLIRRLLRLRAGAPELFARGAYLPLSLQGPAAPQLLAFARVATDRALLVLTPRSAGKLLLQAGSLIPQESNWSASELLLPPSLAGRNWRHVLGDRAVQAHSALPVAALLPAWPVAVMTSETTP
jgi:(1->4)-alpha-D-glucan 1-alpha-D-glucosylmutase